jgi:chorismate mutase
VSDPAQDPFVRQLRQQISDNDRALVGAINKRLELVSRLKAYKESRGFDFVDTTREQHMLQDLLRANRGPLSTDGLSALYTEVLALTKREVAPDEGA